MFTTVKNINFITFFRNLNNLNIHRLIIIIVFIILTWRTFIIPISFVCFDKFLFDLFGSNFFYSLVRFRRNRMFSFNLGFRWTFTFNLVVLEQRSRRRRRRRLSDDSDSGCEIFYDFVDDSGWRRRGFDDSFVYVGLRSIVVGRLRLRVAGLRSEQPIDGAGFDVDVVGRQTSSLGLSLRVENASGFAKAFDYDSAFGSIWKPLEAFGSLRKP